jgi:methylenetetrahydrofolate reductase (NADPH)
MKAIDLIHEASAPFFSFEYFPPKTPEGVANLSQRLFRMATLKPLFVDVTWGAGGSTAQLTLEISARAQRDCGLETMMHLTCTNMAVADIRAALVQAKEAGIMNILALRGGTAWR